MKKEYSFEEKSNHSFRIFQPNTQIPLQYINNANSLADSLIIIVNNNKQRELKNRAEFQL